MQLLGFGKADRPPLQPFETGPKVEVVPLDPQRPAFAYHMTCLRYHPVVRRPAVGMETANDALVHLLDQATTFLIGPAAIDMCNHTLALPIEAGPSLARPHLRTDNDHNSSISKSLILKDTGASDVLLLPENNIVEQDHRFIKRQVNPGLRFFSFKTARRTIKGYEVMITIRKGQVEGIEKGDIQE